MVTILKTKAVDLTSKETKQCLSLVLRSGGHDGLMAPRLREARHFNYPDRTYRVVDDKGTLLAWALLFSWGEQEFHKGSETLNVYVYTRNTERRKGYGTLLLRSIEKDWGSKVRTHPWDERSVGFYMAWGQTKLTKIDEECGIISWNEYEENGTSVMLPIFDVEKIRG